MCIIVSHSWFWKKNENRTTVIRPTQSIMYVPLQVNRLQKSNLLIVQHKYLKSCSRNFYSQESDPPHKIMRYWFHDSIYLVFSFPPDHAGLWKCFVPQLYQFRRGSSGGPALKYVYMIYRGGRIPGRDSRPEFTPSRLSYCQKEDKSTWKKEYIRTFSTWTDGLDIRHSFPASQSKLWWSWLKVPGQVRCPGCVTKRCTFPEILSFHILNVDQNSSKAIDSSW